MEEPEQKILLAARLVLTEEHSREPVFAELQPVEEWSCSLAAARGQMTERVGVSSLAGWESEVGAMVGSKLRTVEAPLEQTGLWTLQGQLQAGHFKSGAGPLAGADHFASVDMTPAADGADQQWSCRTVQAEQAGPQEGWRSQGVSRPCEWLLQGAVAVGVGQPQDPPTLGGWWPHFDRELALVLVQSTGGHKV